MTCRPRMLVLIGQRNRTARSAAVASACEKHGGTEAVEGAQFERVERVHDAGAVGCRGGAAGRPGAGDARRADVPAGRHRAGAGDEGSGRSVPTSLTRPSGSSTRWTRCSRAASCAGTPTSIARMRAAASRSAPAMPTTSAPTTTSTREAATRFPATSAPKWSSSLPGSSTGAASLSVLGGWREAPQVGFYGIGTNTSNDDRTNYLFQQPYASALVTVFPTRKVFMIGGGAEFSQWSQEPGKGSYPVGRDEIHSRRRFQASAPKSRTSTRRAPLASTGAPHPATHVAAASTA